MGLFSNDEQEDQEERERRRVCVRGTPRKVSCACDFCSGRKTWDDNWCPSCAKVKMTPPKWWEDMDLCDTCEKLFSTAPEDRGDTTVCPVIEDTVPAPDAGAGPPVSIPRFLPRSVTCAWCANRYQSACPSDLDRGLQGSHCASDVVQEGGDWFVRGGYGSDAHDMHRYLFVANKPSAPADPVCDECISERLQAGDLRDTGVVCTRRPGDFGPRPFGTWAFVHQIRDLVENEVVMRRLVDAVCREHDKRHPPDEDGPACAICAEIREYRKHQRWIGEIEDGGEEYVEGCPEVAGQLREAARELEELAAFWERQGVIEEIKADD